ncbi:copper amine oxidase N-terminal domain-containing protein [Paenibacillus sp. NPDC058174]|uniref:copper amine oxidase N-terminal domain-containing protein n=1 Tax=Paenibacillus sp. NPDC058174 TaxID=3346366 RepID=UPI0036D7EC97
MKRIMGLMLILVLLLSNASLSSAAVVKQPEKQIVLVVNEKKIEQKPDLVLQKGTMYIPLNVLRLVGAQFTLSDERKTITINKQNHKLAMKVNNVWAKFDGNTVKLNQAATSVNGSLYVPANILKTFFNVGVKWDNKNSVLTLLDFFPQLQEAIKRDDLSKFIFLLEEGLDPTYALQQVILYQKDASWASETLASGADANKHFIEAVVGRQTELVSVMLEEGTIDFSKIPEYYSNFSYLSWAHVGKEKVIRRDHTGKSYIIQTPASFEIAELLYEYGAVADNLDAYYAITESKPEWLEWMLNHGADPEGETMKLVFLDESEQNIRFTYPKIAPDKNAKQELIVSAYMVASWNPSPENMESIKLLVTKYNVSLEALTHAQKERLMDLAKSMNERDLIDALIRG